jgi:hypothetical protein
MILTPAILDNIRSLKDKTFKVSFETSELTPEQFTAIGNNLHQYGYLAFKNEPFLTEELEAIEDLKTDFDDKGKSPSQRLRAVLFLLFKEQPEGYEDFQLYYNFKMEKVIKHYKKFLPELLK